MPKDAAGPAQSVPRQNPRESAPLAVYVHFPWCLKKCPYCDFLSVAAKREELPHAAYADAVIRELHRRASRLSHRRLSSVFFGGGTPSLWAPAELGRVLASIRQVFPEQVPDLEITAECNPTSFDAERAEALHSVGVNRVSLGVQGLTQNRLEFLGRLHDPDGALTAVRAAVASSIPRVSADLIFGVFGQTPLEASAEVGAVADLGVTHVSAYALTIEPGTQFGALARRGKLPLLGEADVAESFLAVHETLTSRGFDHYEVSNFARGGQVAQHNVNYWLGGDYLGLGCGAWGTVADAMADADGADTNLNAATQRNAKHGSATHGSATHGSATHGNTTRRRYRNTLTPARYMTIDWDAEDLRRASTSSAAAQCHVEEIAPDTAVKEALMLGLRLREGVNLKTLEAVTGTPPLPPERQRCLDRQLRLGHIVQEGAYLRIPFAHWLHADGIIAELM